MKMTLCRAPSDGPISAMWLRAGSSLPGSAMKWSGRMAAPAAMPPSSAIRPRPGETASCSPMRPTMPPIPRWGTHLVNAAYPLPKLRREVQVDPAVLATYAGRYEISPTFILTVRPDGGRLFIQATAQAEFEVYAESETEFFYRVVDAQVSFDAARRRRGAVADAASERQAHAGQAAAVRLDRRCADAAQRASPISLTPVQRERDGRDVGALRLDGYRLAAATRR